MNSCTERSFRTVKLRLKGVTNELEEDTGRYPVDESLNFPLKTPSVFFHNIQISGMFTPPVYLWKTGGETLKSIDIPVVTLPDAWKPVH